MCEKPKEIEKMHTQFDEAQIKFASKVLSNRWNDIFRTPIMRFPIMAIVRVGDGFNDDMDIEDEGMEESIHCDVGNSVPICGTAFDGGTGKWYIQPECAKATDRSDAQRFISWERVIQWRYLGDYEAHDHWNSLREEVREMNGEQKEDKE